MGRLYLLSAATCLLLVVSLAPPVHGQAEPSPAPDAAGTDAGKDGAAPATVETPKGYERVEAGGRFFVCQPGDAEWVRKAAEQAGPEGGPTTRPADLLLQVGERRPLVVAAMLRDMPDLKPSQIDQVLDEKVIPSIKQLSTARPRIVYLVSSPEALRQAMRDGWTDRRFRYNRAGDLVEFDRTVSVNVEREDESAVAALYDPNDAVEDRVQALARYVAQTEAQVMQQVSSRALTVTLVTLADFIARDGLPDLPRKDDQVWLVSGLSNVLSARYVSMLHGAPLRDFVDAMIVSSAPTPVNAASIDLLNPIPVESLRPEFVAPQLDARRRKSIAVMYLWMEKAGVDKLHATVNAVHDAKPADGATLARVVKDSSGVDLIEMLQPR